MTILALFLLAGVVAFAQVPGQHHAKHMGAEHYAKVLDDPSRDAWQKPHEVVVALSLRKGETIADIGAGTGYFARRFAQHVGQVFALDIEPKLLDIAAKGAPANLKTVLGTPTDPKLEPESVDTIFFCNVLHHIEDRSAYLRTVNRALKPGGRIVIVDFHKKELPIGPPPAMKIARDDVVAEFKKAGFQVAKEHTLLPHQYFLEFRK